mgnify:FL=1|tara:strand:+ start:575 stop:778 length:204 start_codon:yes stop_codon:yes gene_type:complete
MKTAIKTEFICVKPRSKEAEDRFVNKMDKLHSCRVEKREYGKVYLSSISGRYMFTMFENGDDHWEVL